jgi:peptide/nickel transport system ATP-binding protein
MGFATSVILRMTEPPLLCVEGLSVHAGRGPGRRTLVEDLALCVAVERVALVGESGSGKSLTARALLGLLPPGLSCEAARLEFAGHDLRACTPRAWAALRGASLALILQDPRHALNPALNVERQLDEILRLHGTLGRAQRRERIATMLEAVGLPPSARILAAYPHELSGGMGQRVMIAMMLINGPRLLIADEPTSALDAGLREQVLELIATLVATRHMGLLLISHDLQSVARHCERVLIMYRGRIVDHCPAADLAQSSHPYTRTLWSCRPSGSTYGTPLPTLDRDALDAMLG